MEADGRTVPGDEVVSADICVVGSGPAGITIAYQLDRAGFEVVLIERGPLRREGLPRSVDTAINVGLDYPVNESRAFEIGGSTYNWKVNTPLGSGFGRFRELDSEDFDRRPWIPNSGWPITKHDLQPYYRQAEKLFGLEGGFLSSESSGHSPFTSGVPELDTRVFYFVSPGIFGGELRKALAHSERALVLGNSTAAALLCEDTESVVSSLRVKTDPSHSFSVQARFYVLAAGGIENPRLLLLSRDRHANGLGNREDLVGRFFMEHPHYASGSLIPYDRGLFGERNAFGIFLHRGTPMQRKYALSERIVEAEELNRIVYRLEAKPLNESTLTLRFDDHATSGLEAFRQLRKAALSRTWSLVEFKRLTMATRGIHHLVRLALRRAVMRIGASAGYSKYTEPQLFWIRAMAEQIPDRENRVRLAASQDRLGMQRAELNWRLDRQDIRSIIRSQELIGRALEAGGIGTVDSLVVDRELPPALSGGKHHIGTTRMSVSPSQGVVDQNCKVHGISNLYVAGSSVFPTSGYANPTLTILAVAYRLADHLSKQSQLTREVRVRGSSSSERP